MRNGQVDRGRRARDRLLDAVIEHFAADGLADQSLRRIAEAIGTSHRMLLYHFGSKDGLLVEVVRAVEARTQGAVRRDGRRRPAGADRRGGAADVGLRRRPRRWADFERLFFALYGAPSRATRAAAPLLRGRLERWLAAQRRAGRRAGSACPPRSPASTPDSALAVIRGLLLDLLATGDRGGVDAALEVFARRYAGRWWEAQPTVPQRAPEQPTAPRSARGARRPPRTRPLSPLDRRVPSAMAVAWNPNSAVDVGHPCRGRGRGRKR